MKNLLIYISSFILIQGAYDWRENQSVYDDGLFFELLGWKGALVGLIIVIILSALLKSSENLK